MQRTAEQNKELHRLLGVLDLAFMKADLVYSFSGGRTQKSSELTAEECANLIQWLKNADFERHDKSRRTIFHYLKLMGFDQPAIYIFIRNIGANNPKKKPLHNLGGNELNKIVTQVKAMYKNELRRNIR